MFVLFFIFRIHALDNIFIFTVQNIFLLLKFLYKLLSLFEYFVIKCEYSTFYLSSSKIIYLQ